MNIKKVDDKPMVIHTKEKTKLHVKTAPETKIKAGNVLTVERTPKFAGAEREATADNMDKRMSALKVKSATKDSKGKADAEKRLSDKRGQSAQSFSVKSKSVKEDIKKSMQKENRKYAQFEKSKQDREKAIGKKNGSTVSTLASAGAKTSLDQMEGGSEVYESYMVARNLSRPVESATDAGRRLYRTQAAKAKEKRIKKVQAGKKISKKAAKDSAAKAAKETSKAEAKAAAKETTKTAAKAAAATEGTAAGTATTGVEGVLIGAAAGEAVGIAMDSKYESKPFDQRMTPYTEEGRRIYSYYRNKSKPLPCDRPSVNTARDIQLSVYAKTVFNFEYFMNREYAYNRDKGKCKCCKEPLFLDNKKFCYHIKGELPLKK